MTINKYDIVIIGGGPVGVALGIELGLQGVNTLILEKYAEPLKTPRAQSLSARTMEFFLRWNIDVALENRILLPKNLPQAGVWCSTLNGKTYFSGYCGDNDFKYNESPKQAVRIPLWITEQVLRQRLKDFPSVTFLTNHDVQDIEVSDDDIKIRSMDRTKQVNTLHQGHLLACCDGALGPSKKIFNNKFNSLSDKARILSVSFISHDILNKKIVPDGIFYSIVTEKISAFLSPIDLNQGLWVAQIIYKEGSEAPDTQTLSLMLNNMIGETFDKQIIGQHFWDMQVQLADFFSFKNRVFWLGDSAHAFAPTGGLGLNTGFGDAQNLGWKLAEVIKNKSAENLLATYEEERRPVWMNNLAFAKKNAADFLEIKQRYPIEKSLDAFARASATLGKQFLNSSKLTMGYRYGGGLEQDIYNLIPDVNIFQYIPIAEPGYFLPHTCDELGMPIYKKLSAVKWNLVVCGSQIFNKEILAGLWAHFLKNSLPNLINMAEGAYPYSFLLLRPDWHIVKVGNSLEELLES